MTLFGASSIVFPVRKNKADYCYYHSSCKNYIKTFHLLILLFWWYGKKCYHIYNQCCYNNKDAAFEIKFSGQGCPNQTGSEQILDYIHQHFARFLPSLAVPHVPLYHNCLLAPYKNSIITIIYLPELIVLMKGWLFKGGLR